VRWVIGSETDGIAGIVAGRAGVRAGSPINGIRLTVSPQPAAARAMASAAAAAATLNARAGAPGRLIAIMRQKLTLSANDAVRVALKTFKSLICHNKGIGTSAA
jgi:hypothetical protein